MLLSCSTGKGLNEPDCPLFTGASEEVEMSCEVADFPPYFPLLGRLQQSIDMNIQGIRSYRFWELPRDHYPSSSSCPLMDHFYIGSIRTTPIGFRLLFTLSSSPRGAYAFSVHLRAIRSTRVPTVHFEPCRRNTFFVNHFHCPREPQSWHHTLTSVLKTEAQVLTKD